MASIFTYEPDPPRVSSPWLAAASSGRVTPAKGLVGDYQQRDLQGQVTDVVDSALRLEAEPQEGPTEYKLLLLLRPRRSSPTAAPKRHISGSYHSSRGSPSPQPDSLSSSAPAFPSANSQLTRQHRLEQLTTQLLWRLQQSSPHHSTSINHLVLPSLPAALTELQAPERPSRLLPGLEESNGALYEIGVSDDGTLVGITMDEMTESLTNLRAMAGSLGCTVEVLRMVTVGESSTEDHTVKQDVVKLYVAEAYVKPVLSGYESSSLASAHQTNGLEGQMIHNSVIASSTEQLRVSLTGATTCGKSSLLGTLSTSTLDNGRGKSRLSLLKHRHEIASGVTSSVAQEVIGYQGNDVRPLLSAGVLNYAHRDVSTWSDILTTANLCRTALLIDSAGHPRFRRTTVRGLVGWAPHWTFLCIAANEDHSQVCSNGHDHASDQDLSFAGANAHISMAHLELCLKLDLPLVIVITKFDEAVLASLRQLLSTLLTRLKNAGRKPIIMSNSRTPVTEDDLQSISADDLAEVRRLSDQMSDSEPTVVPILFTSAVKGTGIAKLHALLCALDIRITPELQNEQASMDSRVAFQIDDCFSLPVAGPGHENVPLGSVVSGYASGDAISIGDQLWLGPINITTNPRQTLTSHPPPSSPNDPFLEPRSFNDALARSTASPSLQAVDASYEWRRVSVVSIRNLRLPVHTLQPDQVGTIGLAPLDWPKDQAATLQVRKGMILSRDMPLASHTFTARFAAAEATSVVVGTVVIVYCKGVRAGARVVAIALDELVSHGQSTRETRSGHDNGAPAGVGFNEGIGSAAGSYDEESPFALDDIDEGARQAYSKQHYIRVTLQFVAGKEYIGPGSQVLLMPSGGAAGGRRASMRDLASELEGFVGIIVDRFG